MNKEQDLFSAQEDPDPSEQQRPSGVDSDAVREAASRVGVKLHILGTYRPEAMRLGLLNDDDVTPTTDEPAVEPPDENEMEQHNEV